MAIHKETNLIVADNSGAREIRCFHIFGSTGRDTAGIGDIIKCAVKSAIPGGQVKKGDIVTAIIVRTRKPLRRNDGSYIRFGENAAVIIKSREDTTPLGSRIFGPIAREVRAVSPKIPSLALEVL
jgi:large subunit ribosomal protein L14